MNLSILAVLYIVPSDDQPVLVRRQIFGSPHYSAAFRSKLASCHNVQQVVLLYLAISLLLLLFITPRPKQSKHTVKVYLSIQL